jgi:hypothetical protein
MKASLTLKILTIGTCIIAACNILGLLALCGVVHPW